MKKVILFFLFCILVLNPPLLLAQESPQPQETAESEQTQILTGVLIKISDTQISIIISSWDINVTHSFIIAQETVIVGNLEIGKVVEVQYINKKFRRAGNIRNNKTALKITVLE